eukprot:scaffold2706_cov415-Prasinococcus_capsulatus_cf.AAC.5
MAMIVAIVIMALPITVVGTSFTIKWVEYKDKTRRMERMQRLSTRPLLLTAAAAAAHGLGMHVR